MAGPLLVCDAPHLLYRAFYALPDSIKGPDGQPTNALLGSVNVTLQVIEEHAPRAVVMCFGAEAAEYRTDAFPAYHADRPPMPDGLAVQWAKAPGLYEALGWKVLDHSGLEADDLMHSLALAEERAGGKALIFTGDRDMFQCATENVHVLMQQARKGFTEMGPEEVREWYGIGPEQVPDFIALRGDPSDGLPGAKGIGAKTAADILQRKGDLEHAILGAIREKPSVRRALIEQADELRSFKEIATLVEVELDAVEDRETDWAGGAKAASRARHEPARGAAPEARRLGPLGPHRVAAGASRLAEPAVDPELELAGVLAEPAGPADRGGELDGVGADRERGGGDAAAEALGGAVGALAVGVGEHHQELVVLPADDHVAAAQRAGEAGAGVVEDGGGGLGRERAEAVEPGLDQRERVAVPGGAGDEEVELAFAEAAVAEAGDRVGEALGLRVGVAGPLDRQRAGHRGHQLAGVDRIGQAGVRAGAQQRRADLRRRRAAEDDDGRDRHLRPPLQRGEDRGGGIGADDDDDVGRRPQRLRGQPRVGLVPLRGERADERLVPALGDDQDAARTPLHGGEVWRGWARA